MKESLVSACFALPSLYAGKVPALQRKMKESLYLTALDAPRNAPPALCGPKAVGKKKKLIARVPLRGKLLMVLNVVAIVCNMHLGKSLRLPLRSLKG
jgi:hypothetical protein